MRAMVQRELRMKENEQHEQELCQLTNKARAERTDAAPTPPVGAKQCLSFDNSVKNNYNHLW